MRPAKLRISLHLVSLFIIERVRTNMQDVLDPFAFLFSSVTRSKISMGRLVAYEDLKIGSSFERGKMGGAHKRMLFCI